MTYNVFGGTLNLTQPTNLALEYCNLVSFGVGVYAGNLGNSLGLTNKPNKWTNIAEVDEPRYVNLEEDAPSDLRVTDMYHNRPVVSFSDEYACAVIRLTKYV